MRIVSTAILEGALTKILLFGFKARKLNMSSTRVVVFPVPGVRYQSEIKESLLFVLVMIEYYTEEQT